MVLTCAFETSHKIQAYQIALNYQFKLLSFLNNSTDIEIKYEASKVFIPLLKVMFKYQDPDSITSMVQSFKNNLFIHKKIGINICKALNQIISSVGDLNTNKSQSNNLNII